MNQPFAPKIETLQSLTLPNIIVYLVERKKREIKKKLCGFLVSLTFPIFYFNLKTSLLFLSIYFFRTNKIVPPKTRKHEPPF